jgi:MYXO-CTERM domain-containing protein
VLSNWGGQQADPDLQGLPVPEPAVMGVLTLGLALRRRR